MRELEKNNHHILFTKKEHDESSPHRKMRHQRGLQVYGHVEPHIALHNHCERIPLVEQQLAQRALELYTDYPNDNLRSLDEYSRAIDVATKHESLSQRDIGQKVIELVRAQIPFIEEMLDDRQYY